MRSHLPTPGLLRAVWRDLWGHGLQLILMVLGVALGTAVVVAIDLANISAAKAFDLSTEALVGQATHQVDGGPSGVSVQTYRELVLGFERVHFAPVVEAIGSLPALGDRPVRILGVDLLAETPFRDLLSGARNLEALAGFYVLPDQAMISAELADQAGLHPGSEVTVQVGQDLRPIRITAIVRADDGSSSLPEDVLLMDVAVAQDLLGEPDRLTRIDVISPESELGAIRDRVPDGVSLRPASEQAGTAADLTSAFRLNLTALSLLALVVGVFLIYNTLMFSIVRRRQVFAILRAIGVTRGQVVLLLLFEAAVVGLTGGSLGVLLGWGLGQGAVSLVSQTINDLYFVVTVRETALTLGLVAKGLALALVAAVLASLPPGLEAASIAPSQALRRSSLERVVQRWIGPVSGIGVALQVGGVLALGLGPSSLPLSFAGMFMILIGLAFLVPLGTVAAMGGLARLFRLVGSTYGRVAARTINRALSRTSVAIAALMVALSVTIGVGLMIESFRGTVEDWLDVTLRADVYVSRPVSQGSRPTADLDPDLAKRLAHVDGVVSIETFRALTVESEAGEVQLTVVDSNRPRDRELYRTSLGSPEQVWESVQSGSVLVSEPLAVRTGIEPGRDSLRIRTDRGWVLFPVTAIYYDYSSDRGAVLMTEQVYKRYWQLDRISSLALFLEQGAVPDDVAAQVREELAGTGLQVQQNQAVREQALRIFDRTFAITSALRLLAVVVAFVGILSALLALQMERQRELATLRALGITPAGLARLTFLETGLMGAAAAVMSIPTGLVLAAVLAYVINVRSFGWRIDLVLSGEILLQAVTVGILAAMVAGLYPILRLERLPVAAALRGE